MLSRFRSFYGKIITFFLVTLMFVIYIKVLQVDHVNKSSPGYAGLKNLYRLQNPSTRSELIESENEIQRPTIKSTDIDLNSIYELSIQRDLARQQPGWGDNGEATLLEGAEKIRGEEIYRKIALNGVLSERLSYNRTLDDYRNPLCVDQYYDVNSLPSASVIIIFFNEPYSVLIRTVHSTLNTCNSRLLKQIILVDDGSENEELGGKLDYYIRTRLPQGKISIVRLKNRLGLIRARLAGARNATGDVLIFLDAHCEANIGWCEPLLQRIKESRSSVLVPIIDVIDASDFKYHTTGYKTFQVGGFQWSGHFDWVNIPARERQRQQRECKMADTGICPTYSPTMAGGLFAIDRSYFWEVGSYDEQMDGWGGENLEMSFRIWQCGGKIETIPCSRVGHVFRDFHPYKFPNNRDTHGINTARMALVWMDDYVNIFFVYRPDLKFNADVGDVTHRVMLRKKLRCKSFDWYLKNVFPEKFIPNKNVKSFGRVKSLHADLCLDDLQQDNEQPYNLGLFMCMNEVTKTQFFSLTNNNVLRNDLSCATVKHTRSPPYLVVMASCFDNDDYNEKWYYDHNYRLRHFPTGLCLDHRGLRQSDYVRVAPCDSQSKTQSWIFGNSEIRNELVQYFEPTSNRNH
uniref:Polypeptide N-acetylgalactosaminyltransferase n=1 Tax=Glossina brevipalpis TaxID=37001 RepID=A0A1A9WWG0_9MUSC